MLNKFRNNDKGFTLVELMMVIVILGVLAGVAVPMVGRMRENALRSKMGSYADAVGSALILAEMAGDFSWPAAGDTYDTDLQTEVNLHVKFSGEDVDIKGSHTGIAANNTLVIEADGTTGFKIQAYAAGTSTALFDSEREFAFAQ